MEITSGCAFCAIVAGRAPAVVVRRWDNVLAIRPRRGGVTAGHLLVISHAHVADVGTCPATSAEVFAAAAELAGELPACNVITSRGRAASQTFPRGRTSVVHCRSRRPNVPVPDSSRRGVPHAVSVSDDGREARR